MRASDITNPSERFITKTAHLILSRRRYSNVSNFDAEFENVFNAMKYVALRRSVSNLSNSDYYDLCHELDSACTDKLKQAVLEELKLMKLDSIT